MKRSNAILLIDVISFAAFLFLTSTGILLHYLLPPGSGRWSTIWGMSRHQWGDIHFYVSLIFFLILSAHLLFHWRVLINMLRGHKREGSPWRLALGVLGLVSVLLLAAAPLITPAQTTSAELPYRGGR